VFGVLARATMLMAVAPPVPVSWWPGASTLPESVLRRLPGAGTRRVERAPVTGHPPSSARIIAIPVDDGRRVGNHDAPAIERIVASMTAPWGEPPVPFLGVTVSTCEVPRSWLRDTPIGGTVIPMRAPRVSTTPEERAGPAPRAAVAPARRATIIELPRQPRALPPVAALGVARSRGRFRRALTLAFGLLLSLVAVEAAARSGRR
jgi:hypothetical protein